ncbi:hypothetical protein ASZ90_018892 [hydrocarbon metagenome]|uniref:Uncharacterized protein n=1 Tax=hydrocarbon metagenome TaxID=938273 RepID=A0A0W8E5L1_9ZZZZ
MTEINGRELIIAVLILLIWCMIIIKALDIWANKQYYDLRKIYRAEIQTINRELMEKVHSNTAQVEKIHRMLDRSLLEMDAKLECLMENSSQINTIDVRTSEIAREVRKIPGIEFKLREALKDNRPRTLGEYMVKEYGKTD